LKICRILVGLDDDLAWASILDEDLPDTRGARILVGLDDDDPCKSKVLPSSIEILTSIASSELPRSNNLIHFKRSFCEKQPEVRRALAPGCLLDSVSATLLFNKTVGSEKSSSAAEAREVRLS